MLMSIFLQDSREDIARQTLMSVAPTHAKTAVFAQILSTASDVLVLLASLEKDAREASPIADMKILA